MLRLNQLTTDSLDYLRAKWTSEIHELKRQLLSKRTKLEARLDRAATKAAELAEMHENLKTAEQLLATLGSTGAAPALLTQQQHKVATLRDEIDHFTGTNLLVSEYEAQLLYLQLDELSACIAVRAGKIREIDATWDNRNITKPDSATRT